jgi:hypothetical protein
MRGSKNNPYICPECGYHTTRHSNLKIHLERSHGLLPFLPRQSKEQWVWSQFHSLARKCAEARLAGDDDKSKCLWDSLLGLYKYHKDVIRDIGMIPKTINDCQKELERKKK